MPRSDVICRVSRAAAFIRSHGSIRAGAINDPLLFPKSRVGPNATDGGQHAAALCDLVRADLWCCTLLRRDEGCWAGLRAADRKEMNERF